MYLTQNEKKGLIYMAIREVLKRLYPNSQKEFHEDLKQALLSETKTFIITANPEIVMKANEDKEIQSMLVDEQVQIVADGIGIVKAYEMLQLGSVDRIPGVEIVEALFTYANIYHKRVCILGAKQDVLNALQVKFTQTYPNLELVSAIHGYVEDKDAIMKSFCDYKPDIILVALGVPSQEKLIYRHLDAFDHGIFVGIGGSLDVLSGMKKRAPKFFVKMNLEWLYRIAKEPNRLKRFYESNVKFISKVRKERKTI